MTVVVVGASVGGVRTAQALRSRGYPGRVVLVGDEPSPPYDKPALSKALLAGSLDQAENVLLTADVAKAQQIELMLGRRAEALDLERQELHLEGRGTVSFDHLVVATGARARESPWGVGAGVHVLRTMKDSVGLQHDLRAGGHLVIVGGGVIGAEVASSARSLGVEVTIVEPQPTLMGRLFGQEIGERFEVLHRRHGVTLRLGRGVEGIDGKRRDLSVHLDDGTVLSAATVLVCIGTEPNDEWLRSSGLTTADGLVCDEFSAALGSASVHGVGDVARWLHLGHGELVRVEHWTNAVEQASCVAHNIVHPESRRRFEPVEYVWSDQFDWKAQIVGRAAGRPMVVLGGASTDDRFAALYGREDGRLTGAVVVNWPKAMLAARRGMAASEAVDVLRERIVELS